MNLLSVLILIEKTTEQNQSTSFGCLIVHFEHIHHMILTLTSYFYSTEPVLESKGMRSIFQKKGKNGQKKANKCQKRAKKAKIFQNLGKNVQNLKIF